MPILHIVNKSPFERNSLDSCLRLSKEGSAVLLIEDAVLAARKNSTYAATLAKAIENRSIFALEADLKARGLSVSTLLKDVRVVDYGGFVDLTIEYTAVQSWL